jgi:hypothetical protein
LLWLVVSIVSNLFETAGSEVIRGLLFRTPINFRSFSRKNVTLKQFLDGVNDILCAEKQLFATFAADFLK